MSNFSAPGGDFQTVLDEDMVPFEEDVKGFLKQILEALTFVHERDIAHLDIKPQNIVLMGAFPNCEIKLCDLEVARVIQKGESIREIIGTPDYVGESVRIMICILNSPTPSLVQSRLKGPAQRQLLNLRTGLMSQ